MIALPVPGASLGGLDSLLSTVQMPPGIPVATVGIGGARNAALLAISILAVSDPELRTKLDAYRASQAERMLASDERMRGGN